MVCLAADRNLFAIRSTLAESALDTVITFGGQNSTIQIRKEFTVKSVLLLAVGLVSFMTLVTTSMIRDGGIIGTGLFSIGYILLVWEIAKTTPTRDLAIDYFPVLINYLPHSQREISFRRTAPSYPITMLTGIKDIAEDGLIRFGNDDIGQVFEVVGSASSLMFNRDKQQVVQDARLFYRNVSPLTSMTIDTIAMPQRVKLQLQATDWQKQHLSLKNSPLSNLLDNERKVLELHVGKKFSTYHQFMIVRSVNTDEMGIFLEWLKGTIDSRSMYLKDIRPLDTKKETVDYIHGIFSNEMMNDSE